jgi:hypothetical protein
VIVNASLAGVAPDSAATSCSRNFFERRWFCAGVGTAEGSLPGQARHSKNSHVELLRDCECVPSQEWRQTRLELQELSGAGSR